MIAHAIQESIDVKQKLLEEKYVEQMRQVAESLIHAIRSGHTVYSIGNGGSAADAQHFAAELAGQFEKKERRPLPAIALTTNTSNITAIANDFGYEHIFSRQLVASAKKGDAVFAISTSGNSENIIHALKKARGLGLTTIGLTGENGGKMKEWCDRVIMVPSTKTARIQECHLLILHTLCEAIDEAFG